MIRIITTQLLNVKRILIPVMTNEHAPSPQEIPASHGGLCKTVCKNRKDVIMAKFGEKVRMRREEMQLSQEQLGSLCGLTRRSIVSYETTNKIPYASSMRKLAAALGVTVRYLEHDEIDDPQAGIEEEPFIQEAREMYGKRGADEMAALLTQNEQLFAGGTLTEDQKDMFFEAVSRAYFANKERARNKYGRRDPKKQMD